jgi:prepilin-type N-terminal cleavage/methylation domain-containing protein
MLKLKLSNPEQGFTLIEVLAAILITTVFVATTMQMLAIAAVYKARAKQNSEAIALIQQDLESVKSRAAILKTTTLTATASPGDSTITVVSNSTVTPNSNFVVGDKLRVGSDMLGYNITGISGNTITISPSLQLTNVTNLSLATPSGTNPIQVDTLSGFSAGDSVKIGSSIYKILATNTTSTTPTIKTMTLDQPLTASQPMTAQVQLIQPAGSIVSAINVCPTLTYTPTATTGFGYLLQQYLPTASPTVSNPNYTISRTITVKPTAPFEIVQLAYNVKPQAGGTNGTNILAKVDAEVMAEAAVKCP